MKEVKRRDFVRNISKYLSDKGEYLVKSDGIGDILVVIGVYKRELSDKLSDKPPESQYRDFKDLDRSRVYEEQSQINEWRSRNPDLSKAGVFKFDEGRYKERLGKKEEDLVEAR